MMRYEKLTDDERELKRAPTSVFYSSKGHRRPRLHSFVKTEISQRRIDRQQQRQRRSKP